MDSSSVATAAEDARPDLNSDGGEAPSTDEDLQEIATPSHQLDAVDPAATTGNNEQRISQSDGVSAGEDATVAEDATPSHDSNGGNNTAVDGGQQEPDSRIHQSDAADAAPATSNDGGTRENTIQSDSLTISQNVTETESATTVPNVDLSLVENGLRVENIPINNGPLPQSDGRLPSQPDAELDTERNLEPDPALGAEPDAQPAQELDSAADLVPDPESGSEPSLEEESEEEDETRDTYKVRLAQISSENLTPREVELNQAFGQAIVDGNLEKFIRLLEEGAKIDSRFDDEDDGDPNQTTLFLAARHDWPKIAAKILELKYDKDFLLDDETNGWTAAHIAAQNNNVDVLRQILKAGDRIGIMRNIINFENRDKETPLLLAAREDCVDIVNILLDHHADWKIESTNEGTPLHSAAYHGSKKAFDSLLAMDGAKNLIGKQDNDGWTVLHSAARGGVEVASLLGDESILKLVTKRTQSTPLLIAALNGNKDILISLLAAGSDLLAKTNDGRTVLHMAAESGSVETLEELVGKLDRDTIVWKDDKGGTALSVAAAEQNYEAVCFLMGHEAFALPRLKLGASAKVNQRDIQEVRRFLIDFIEDKSESELNSLMHWHLIVHWAVYYGWQSVARTCFNRQGNLCDLKTKSGETLLHVAACNGYPGVLEQLMVCFKKRGSMETNVMAKISDKTNDEIIPLHFAAGNGYVDTMRSLLEGSVSDQLAAKSKDNEALLFKESWAQILVESRNGETALYFAARNGHENAVSFLLRWLEKHSELQSIIRKKTKDGKTPLSQAADNGHQGVAKTLLKVLTEHDFGGDSRVAWDELTEVARTGLEEYVELIVDKKILVSNIPGNNPQDLFPDQNWTGLLWAVYYGHYKVVWWLLRRNGPTILTSPIFEDATDMVDILLTKLNNTASLTLEEKSEKEQRYREIKDCLYSPPRVENVYDQYDPDGSPSVPQPSGKKEMVCKKYRATIVDFYNKAGHVSFAALSRTMLETIYDTSLTLDEIMTGAGMDRKEPKSLNKASGVAQPSQNAVGNPVSQPTAEAPAAGTADFEAPPVAPATRQPAPETPAAGTQKHAAATRQEQSSKKKNVREDGYRFRWIHVPANNVSKTPILKR
jgi:ankyrin repeat protein